MVQEPANSSGERDELTLNEAATHVLEECRTVVPGMQALFGFQLVAVFSTAFKDLTVAERIIHLISILLVTVAIALVMAPAALHRQSEPLSVSRRFIDGASRLLMASMVPLAAGLCLDLYIVSRVILGTFAGAIIISALALVVFIVCWLILPQSARRRRSRTRS